VKVVDVKKILRKKGLKVSGLKIELATRVKECLIFDKNEENKDLVDNLGEYIYMIEKQGDDHKDTQVIIECNNGDSMAEITTKIEIEEVNATKNNERKSSESKDITVKIQKEGENTAILQPEESSLVIKSENKEKDCQEINISNVSLRLPLEDAKKQKKNFMEALFLKTIHLHQSKNGYIQRLFLKLQNPRFL